ncbi:hypothetical protein BGZ97_013168 [Linnemannia gamsii]|uniref:Ndc10 domain-containing protein n=1 Tax=Linnemannia gamsii TaxID=64522 RepID=A0A9P6QZG7_9FUNG|nr:hypothetical protein BGZ97_013168 [Linnemannia gamsii]
MGLRPDIDGTMATPETVAVISQFRSSQDMPQFVQAPSYQLKLKGALRYLWMKGYNEQECAYVNQWCGTRTRLCLAFDRFKGPRHVLRKNLLTSLYPVYHMDYTSTRSIFPFIEKLFPTNEDWKAWIDNIMMNRPEDTYRSRNWRVHYSKENLPAIRLMLVLAHLRKIILQDIVAMKMCARDTLYKKHRIANSPVFSSKSFCRFEHQLQEAMHGRATRSSAKDRNHAKFQFIRQRSPIVDVVSNTLTAVCGSSLAQLPTPTEDEDANTTLVDPHSLESEFTSQQSMTSCYGNKLQELPQELLGILPMDDDDAEILEIKKSLASMFRYMETESKAVGNFASATFASLDQLQGQMASAEKTVQMLLAKQDALESRSSEQTKQESDLRLLSFQQEPRILEQWLQLQNKLRPWEKNRKQDAGSRQGRAEDSEAQTERSFDMDALRQKMSCTKAVNLDVKRRISNLEADLLAVGNSLRAVAGVGDTEEGAEVDTEAKDEEGNDKNWEVSGDDERDESGEDEQEKTPIDSAALRMTRFGRRMVDPIQQVSRQSYPDDLVELADRIAALYPQHKPDKIRDVDGRLAGVVQRARVEAIILEP